MTKKTCFLLLVLVLLCTCPLGVFASEPVDQVICTTTRGGDYDQLEQTILQGIGQDGSIVWSYDTGMKECGNDSNVYWYGQSGNLFFFNYKGSLQAFDTETGTVIWSTPEGEYSFSYGIFDKAGNICMVNTHGPITLLDRSGVVLSKFNTDRKYSSLIISSMTLTDDNRLIIKYAVEGSGADIKVYNDYQTMPSLSVDLAPYQNRINVTANGNKISFDVPPFIEQDRTFVPVRAIFEALGAQVSWDGQTKTVTAQKDNTTVTMKIGKKEITVNGVTKTLDVAPQIIHDRTMVPARAVSESFGCTVGWEGSSKTVTISTAPINSEQSETLTVNTDLFSYVGQTYGALSSSLGSASETNWKNGPFCRLGSGNLWFGFDDGSWYQTSDQYQMTNDLICNSILTTVGTLIPQIPDQSSLSSVASALGVTFSQPESDIDGNLYSYFNYNNHKITVFLSEDAAISPAHLVIIS